MPEKILLVSDDFLPAKTGVGVYLQSVGQKLADHGENITVLTTRIHNDKTGASDSLGAIKIIRLPTIVVADFPQAICFPWTIGKILDQVQPDIVHIQYLSWMSLLVTLAARRRKIKTVFTYHFSPEVITQPAFMAPFRPWIVGRVKKLLKKMDHVTVPTQFVFKKLGAKDYGVLSDRLSVITNPMPFSTKMTRTQLAKNEGQFDVLYVGRLAPEKNVQFLLESFARAKEKNAQMHLWIAGEGILKEALYRQAKELGIIDSVTFLGHVGSADLAQYYTLCDLFVLPSVMETLSLVTIEAMSFGLPIIVTDRISCAQELVDEGRNGFIVPADSPDTLCDKMVALSRDSDRLAQMGAAALEKSKMYDLDTVVTQIEDVYKKVMRKN